MPSRERLSFMRRECDRPGGLLWPRQRRCAILCCAKNPCLGKKDSLFSEEQGIGCKLLNRLGDRLPKQPKAVRKRGTFPDVPC